MNGARHALTWLADEVLTCRYAPFTLFVLRSWPYPVVGFFTSVITLLVVAPFDPGATIGQTAVLLPCFALLSVIFFL